MPAILCSIPVSDDELLSAQCRNRIDAGGTLSRKKTSDKGRGSEQHA